MFVLLPLVSLVLKVRRHRRRKALGGSGGVGSAGLGIGAGVGGIAAAEAVRRRLGSGVGRSTLGWIWGGAVRAVGDTLRMGGGGLS